MSRSEFLDTLRSQLSGQMQEGKVAAHVQYYQDYIQNQINAGHSEEAVLGELGDPRLIAKTLLDTDADAAQEIYEGSQSSYESGEDSQTQVKRHKYKLDLSTWYGKLAVIAMAAVVLILLIAVIGTILPFFIILSIIVFIFSKFRKK